jgi:GLPGLI family protein
MYSASQAQNANPLFGKIEYKSTLRTSLYIQGAEDDSKNMIVYFSDTSASFYINQGLEFNKDVFRKQVNLKDDAYFEEIYKKLKPEMDKRLKPNIYYHKIGSNVFINSWISPSNIDYCVADSVKEYEWTLLPDTTRILGFLCYKATCKAAILDTKIRNYTVWYTPEIPIPVGPNRFYGLPGLILSIEEKYYSMFAKSISLNANREELKFLKCCTEGKPISTKRYNEILGKQSDDFSNMQILNKN